MKFVFIHGAYGNPEENWFPQLKEGLEALGQDVFVPQFPTPENQNLESWFKVFENVYKNINKNEDACFIGHSLGPLFILHLIDKYNLKLDSAIFVSPFMKKLNNPQFDKINETFYKEDFNFEELKKLILKSYVLYSDNDPYVESSHSIGFARKLNSEVILIKDGGHFNSSSGYNKFPQVLDLCKEII